MAGADPRSGEGQLASRRNGVPRHRAGRRGIARVAVATTVTGIVTALGVFSVAVSPPRSADRAADSSTPTMRQPAPSPTLDAQAPTSEAPTTGPSTRPITPTAGTSPDQRPDPDRPPSAEQSPVAVPSQGSGDFEVVRPDTATPPAGQLPYSVEIERELPFRSGSTARTIAEALNDERGWVDVLGTTFRHVRTDPQVRILVATPETVDALCAPLQTRGRVSCRNGDLVVLNGVRWASGIGAYRGNLRDYRRYLVNHEMGHALGQEHRECPGSGSPAPVMQQQSYGLDGCTQNPWPAVS